MVCFGTCCPRALAILAVILAVGGGLASADVPAVSAPVWVVADDGTVYGWRADPGAPDHPFSHLRPLEGAPPVRDLAAYAGGTRFVALAANPEASGRRRRRREGLALVFDATSSQPRELHRIPLPGEGYAAAITPDGTRAYILSSRPGPAHSPVEGRAWLHEIDLGAGRLDNTLALEFPAAALAVAPGGNRVFLALPGRIQTCRTRPLLTSWFYRSPGANLGLYFPPDSDVLHVMRGAEIARFDLRATPTEPAGERRARQDDASAIIPLPSSASALFFSDDGSLAFAYRGEGRPVFIDLISEEVLPPSHLPPSLEGATLIRPLRFPADGDLLVGSFPTGRVVSIARPAARERPAAPEPPLRAAARTAPPGDPAPPPAEAKAATAPGPSSDPGTGFPPVEPPPDYRPPPAPMEPTRDPGPTPRPSNRAPTAGQPPLDRSARHPVAVARGVLKGRVSGAHDRVEVLVLYGPDSLIREMARVRPGPDGSWSTPVPPPGTYRLVPAGKSSLPVPSTPNFHTITVREGWQGANLDFFVHRGG